MPFTKATARAHALRRWALETDRTSALEKARAGRMRRYYQQVDPDGTMDPAERDERAQALLRADMILLAHKREEARRKKAALSEVAEPGGEERPGLVRSLDRDRVEAYRRGEAASEPEPPPAEDIGIGAYR